MTTTTTTTLSGTDKYGRSVSEAEFSRTWRWNDALDCRQYGWKLLRTHNCDFGSARFFFNLPVGDDRHQGLELGVVWSDDGQTFCH